MTENIESKEELSSNNLPSKFDNRPKGLTYWDGNEIIDGLLLTDVRAAGNTLAHEFFEITSVVSILSHAQLKIQEEYPSKLESFNITKENGNWLLFIYEDGVVEGGIQTELDEAADFIHEHLQANNRKMKQEFSNDSNQTQETELKTYQFRNKYYVLVHCWAGMSRSPTMVAAYLMKYRDYSLPDALELLKTRRNVAHPKVFFVQQLAQFERTLQKRKKNPNGSNNCCHIL